jgi:hypothetical protein
MGYLLSKKINEKNMNIKHYKNGRGYKLYYRLPYCTLNGITFNITMISFISNKNDYIIDLTNNSIKLVDTIDTYLKQLCTIHNYKPMLKYNKIYFKNNEITRTLIEHKNNKVLTLNIINIKKYAYHCNPIVYIV